MEAHLQRIERQRIAELNDQFAVDGQAVDGKAMQRRHHVGKEPGQRLARPALELDLLASLEGQTAETIPFRLELPAGAVRQVGNELGFHGRDVEIDRKP